MPSYNRVILMGNLTRDPELRYLPSNTPVVSIGIAVNRRWKNQAGEPQEETTFVDCESFGKQAEVINQYVLEGQPFLVEGRLRLDQWQDKEGKKRSKMVVVVEKFEFVAPREGPKPEDYAQRPRAQSPDDVAARQQPLPDLHAQGVMLNPPIDEDDIPF